MGLGSVGGKGAQSAVRTASTREIAAMAVSGRETASADATMFAQKSGRRVA